MPPRKLPRVKCQVCAVEINRQSYPDHLLTHKEDPNDTRVFGQRSLFNIPKKKSNVEEAIEITPATDETDSNSNIVNRDANNITLDESVPEYSQGSPAHDTAGEHEEENQEDSEGESHNNNPREIPKTSRPESYTLREVNDKLDEILVSCDLEFDGRQCDTEEEEFEKRVELLRKSINIRAKVKNLTSGLEELKLLSQKEENIGKQVLNHEEVTRLVLSEARSLREITNKLPQFKFNQESSRRTGKQGRDAKPIRSMCMEDLSC